jgi:hypothetical protein
MEMDMQEPGEMCDYYEEKHNTASRHARLEAITGSHVIVHRIIIA